MKRILFSILACLLAALSFAQLTSPGVTPSKVRLLSQNTRKAYSDLQCTNRCYFPSGNYSQSGSLETAMTCRSYHRIAHNVNGIRLVYVNGWADSTTHNGDTDGKGQLSVKALVEYNSQKF